MPQRRRPPVPRSYWFIANLLRPIMALITKRRWSGQENLPATGGFVICSNHMTYADPITLAHYMYDTGYPPYFLAKESIFRVPVFGKMVTAAQQIPVYREGRRAAEAFRAAVDAVNEGKSVPIFPEGTLTRDPELWPMVGKTGAARVAFATKCPVIPVAQWGPQELLEPYGKRPHVIPRRTMIVRAGPPVDLSDLYDRRLDSAVMSEATERIMAAITALLEEIRGEKAPAQRFDPRTAGVAVTGDPRKQKRQPDRQQGHRNDDGEDQGKEASA